MNGKEMKQTVTWNKSKPTGWDEASVAGHDELIFGPHVKFSGFGGAVFRQVHCDVS